jgi:hypothetical protein
MHWYTFHLLASSKMAREAARSRPAEEEEAPRWSEYAKMSSTSCCSSGWK